MPGIPLSSNSYTNSIIRKSINFDKQRINYEKNYVFYNSYVSKWYSRKKGMKELINYFKTNNTRVVTPENKINNTVIKYIVAPEKKPKRK